MRRAALLTLAGTALLAPILLFPVTPDSDQAWLLYWGSQNSWPHFEGGISARAFVWLVSRFVGLFSQDGTVLNVAVRFAAAGLTLAGLFATVRPAWLIVAFVASGYLWLDVSSDLLAASCVALLCWSRQRSLGWFLLAGWLLCFAKPDLLIPGLALGVGLAWTREDRWGVIVSLCAAVAITLMFSAMLTEEPSIHRATLSLGQHYGFLKYGEDGWHDWRSVLDRDFGIGATWQTVVLSAEYGAFLRGSVLQSLRALWASGLLWLLPPCLYALWLRRDWSRVGFIALTGISVTALAYLHDRYLARVLMLGLIVIGEAWPLFPARAKAATVAAVIGYAVARLLA